MKQVVQTGLKAENVPLEWAILADGILYTAQIPMRTDGSIETGDIGVQTEVTLANLRRTVEAAGGTMADVTQVLIYLPDPSDFAGMNAVYRECFPRPYPNRATVVAQLMVPGARIEIVAYAHVKQGLAGRGKPASASAARGSAPKSSSKTRRLPPKGRSAAKKRPTRK
jgi:2-iminobutanoate/2-iminopropanoate deaminase